MKYKLIFLIAAILALKTLSGQQYPFENINLSDDERINNLLSLMTVDEKIANLSSQVPGVARLGVRGTRLVEGLHGLALSGVANWAVKGPGEAPNTTFPQAYGLAQTWDTELIQQIASWEALECRYLAQNINYQSSGLIVLAPNADLGRDVRWGRTEECYGEDAFLTSRLAVAFVKGLQGNDPKYWKSASLMKHFLANSNENNRTVNSSDFDDQLFREYYSYGFYKGITEGGARAYMTAYNKYNGVPCIVSPVVKNVTVNEWGQNGIVCTDGGAFSLLVYAHKYYPDMVAAAAATIKAGVTMYLDFYKPFVKEAFQQKLITETDLDQALRGNLRVILKLGLLDHNPANPYAFIGVADTVRPWTKPEAAALARKATRESIVLLKNEKDLLPLKKETVKSIAVIGPLANVVVPDWYSGTPPYRVTVLEGIRQALGDKASIYFAASNKADSAILAAKKADVAIVCVGNHPLSHGLGWGQNYVASDGREEVDRQAITLEQEDLVKLVKAANPNTVLVLVSSFPYAINWSKQYVPAIVQITHSSQELGNGLADILFGNESPSGRLVQTWPNSIDELPPMLDYDLRHGRTYMYSTREPLFAFGYGLSYTKFEYSNLKTDKLVIGSADTLNVTLTLKNAGQMNAAEVVQLYVSPQKPLAGQPKLMLKGFKRVTINAGQKAEVSIRIPASELKIWDTTKNAFVFPSYPLVLAAGAASNDLRLRTVLNFR